MYIKFKTVWSIHFVYGKFCNFGCTLFAGFNAKILDFAGNGNTI